MKATADACQNGSDLWQMVEAAIEPTMADVFTTMASMPAEMATGQEWEPSDGERLVGSVGLAGALSGLLAIEMEGGLARRFAAALLGIDAEQCDDEQDLRDAIGELANMVAGALASRARDRGLQCTLTIPTVTHGSEFRSRIPTGIAFRRWLFQHGVGSSRVTFCLKQG
jgi:chemotaxis protein CheX